MNKYCIIVFFIGIVFLSGCGRVAKEVKNTGNATEAINEYTPINLEDGFDSCILSVINSSANATIVSMTTSVSYEEDYQPDFLFHFNTVTISTYNMQSIELAYSTDRPKQLYNELQYYVSITYKQIAGWDTTNYFKNYFIPLSAEGNIILPIPEIPAGYEVTNFVVNFYFCYKNQYDSLSQTSKEPVHPDDLTHYSAYDYNFILP